MHHQNPNKEYGFIILMQHEIWTTFTVRFFYVLMSESISFSFHGAFQLKLVSMMMACYKTKRNEIWKIKKQINKTLKLMTQSLKEYVNVFAEFF